nr:hypothetical protein DM860_009049 [Ipomoea batatas]
MATGRHRSVYLDAVAVAVGGVVRSRVLLVGAPALEDNEPRKGFQEGGDGAQEDDHAGVGFLPVLLPVQHIESLVHVDDAEDDHRVPDGVVVDVPVESQLVSAEGEKSDADVTVGVLCNALGIAAELKAGAPSGDADGVSGGLASNVEIEPGGIETRTIDKIVTYVSPAEHRFEGVASAAGGSLAGGEIHSSGGPHVVSGLSVGLRGGAGEGAVLPGLVEASPTGGERESGENDDLAAG